MLRQKTARFRVAGTGDDMGSNRFRKIILHTDSRFIQWGTWNFRFFWFQKPPHSGSGINLLAPNPEIYTEENPDP